MAVLVVLCFLTDPLASGEEALPEDNSTPSVEQTESPQSSDEPLNTPEPEPSKELQSPEPEVLPTPLPVITKPKVSEEVHVHAYSTWTEVPTCTEGGYELWINVWVYTNAGIGTCAFALEVCMHEA